MRERAGRSAEDAAGHDESNAAGNKRREGGLGRTGSSQLFRYVKINVPARPSLDSACGRASPNTPNSDPAHHPYPITSLTSAREAAIQFNEPPSRPIDAPKRVLATQYASPDDVRVRHALLKCKDFRRFQVLRRGTDKLVFLFRVKVSKRFAT